MWCSLTNLEISQEAMPSAKMDGLRYECSAWHNMPHAGLPACSPGNWCTLVNKNLQCLTMNKYIINTITYLNTGQQYSFPVDLGDVNGSFLRVNLYLFTFGTLAPWLSRISYFFINMYVQGVICWRYAWDPPPPPPSGLHIPTSSELFLSLYEGDKCTPPPKVINATSPMDHIKYLKYECFKLSKRL